MFNFCPLVHCIISHHTLYILIIPFIHPLHPTDQCTAIHSLQRPDTTQHSSLHSIISCIHPTYPVSNSYRRFQPTILCIHQSHKPPAPVTTHHTPLFLLTPITPFLQLWPPSHSFVLCIHPSHPIIHCIHPSFIVTTLYTLVA